MLYQLFPNQFSYLHAAGQRQYVQIDGPYDKYGYILKHQDNGTYLIRGMGKSKPA